MANWISNKLKVAETLLQQIDQQAKESLGKGEKPRSDDAKLDAPTKSIGSVSLKDQLRKKPIENNDDRGKLLSDPNLNRNSSFSGSKPKSTLTDSDWTELLGTPNKASSLRGPRKDERRQRSTLGNRNRKITNSGVIKSAPTLDIALGSKVNGGKKPSDGKESGSSGGSSSVEVHTYWKNLEGRDVKPKDEANEEKDEIKKNVQLDNVPRKVDALSNVKIGMNDVDENISRMRGNSKSNAGYRTSESNDSKRGSSATSDNWLDSESDLGLSSESETEQEKEKRRKRREKILAETAAAAKAVEAVKERENMVARLEGEKQSLEKIIEERLKQQAKELAASKGVEFEWEILEAECSCITDKIIQLQDKAKKLEEDVETTRKEIEDATEVEVELKRRLGQLTDHLIQKQAQVEPLSSQKATLAFRIEAVLRLLDENKSKPSSSSTDLESGAWELSQSKLRPLFEDKIHSGGST